METIYSDGFKSFGWSAEGICEAEECNDTIVMRFKRDRKIGNKTELTRLQRQFESCVGEIDMVEQSMHIDSCLIAYLVGAMGTGIMAGVLFALRAGNIPLGIFLAVLGLIGWSLPYFVYKGERNKRAQKANPFIEKKYDEIHTICEKASTLLGANR